MVASVGSERKLSHSCLGGVHSFLTDTLSYRSSGCLGGVHSHKCRMVASVGCLGGVNPKYNISLLTR